MANLITEKQKKVVLQEYYIRLAGFSLFVFSLLGIFVFVYMTLYFLSVSNSDLIVADQLKTVIEVENKENTGESAVGIIKKTTDELSVLEAYTQNTLNSSTIFEKVISQKNSSLILNRLNFSLVSQKSGQLIVSGVAETRESLVTFIGDLKLIPGFTSVESPISDLVKNSNIPFTINIKVNI